MPRLVARPRGVARVVSSGAAVVLAVSLAACGSQLDVDEVAQTSGGSTGTTVSGGEVLPGADAGTVPTGDAPAAAGGAAPSGATAGSVPAGGDPATGGGGGAGGGGNGEGDNSADGGGGGGGVSCDGFKNGPGITDSEILIGNSSDVSGPVPGLFESAQDATKAYVSYFNASSDICGRKLKLVAYDSRTDAAADQQSYAKACEEVFATVGSMSAFDSGGASTAEGCGLPDIRAAAVTKERNACATCFGAQSTNTGEFENAVPDFVVKNYPDIAKSAGFLYINAGASAQNATVQKNAMTSRGMEFKVFQGIDISEFNYAPYVQQLKDAGVEVVFWIGAYQQSVRLRQAMQQQGYAPTLYLRDPTDYNAEFVSSGGDAVEGTVIFLNFVPFEEAASNKEMQLYMGWLQQVKPGAEPTFFGLFAWSAARLFVEQATKLGGGLTRPALIDAVRKVDDWTANDLHSPQHVGPKRTSECWRFIQLSGGQWKPVGGTKYQCSGLSTG